MGMDKNVITISVKISETDDRIKSGMGKLYTPKDLREFITTYHLTEKKFIAMQYKLFPIVVVSTLASKLPLECEFDGAYMDIESFLRCGV
jgi:hypothetical protein